MVTLTKQEVQSVVDNAKNRIVERMATRQEIQTITDNARDKVLNYLHDLMQIHQQNMFRRSNTQKLELTRRMVALETRMVTMETELRTITQLLQQIASQGPQQIVMPATPEDNGRKLSPEQRYTYNIE